MRGLRSFAALLAILVALGAYLYFVESGRTPGDDTEKRDKVFAVEAEQIEELTIKAESGDRTTMRKAGADWQIVAPAPAAADTSEAAGIAGNIATLEQQRVVEENAAALQEFGLAEPRIEVGFKAAGQEHRLLIGSKTPTGADLYAKTGANARVFLIASYVESTFNRGTFELRDKTALKFDRDAADTLEVTSGAQSLRFARENGEWRIAQPPTPRGDTAAIEGLLARLDGAQMKKLVAPNAPDLKGYGLDKPVATVRVGAGSAQATLLVGAKAEGGDVYARDAARPEVFTIEASLLEDLQKDAGAYRQKDIFDARTFNTTHVDIARAGKALVFEKAQDKWRQTAPAPKDADSAKVDALLSALTSARADTFAPAPPAGATTEAAVTLKFDEGRKQERVTFLRSGADAFAVREGTEGAARLPAAALDAILKAMDDLQ